MTVKQRNFLQLLLQFVLLGGLFGLAIVSTITKSLELQPIIQGVLMGFVISLLSVAGNVLLQRRFRKLPFRVFLLLKIVYIGGLGVFVVLFGTSVFPGISVEVSRPFLVFMAILFSLSISVLFSLVMGLQRMLGKGVLISFFTGRYHKPVEEQRIFMFLDMVSSTTVAEQIGHIHFYKFLNEVFFDITPDILAAHGEIYKYVGDEVIISWPLKVGMRNNQCVALYFSVKRTLAAHLGEYERKYGVKPYFRAGMHVGQVIVGEIGDYKREIGFLGDTVNTTARIQEMCKVKQQDLLISESLYTQLEHPERYQAHNFGLIQLRGRKEQINIVSIQPKASTPKGKAGFVRH
ncbi:MAG: adenylate/guanylate cyclase domain-containing protein [Bacteroidales bacterium]